MKPDTNEFFVSKVIFIGTLTIVNLENHVSINYSLENCSHVKKLENHVYVNHANLKNPLYTLKPWKTLGLAIETHSNYREPSCFCKPNPKSPQTLFLLHRHPLPKPTPISSRGSP